MNDKTKISRKKDFYSARLDEETVMMHPETGNYFSLNRVATSVWDKISEPTTVGDIIIHLMAEYEIDENLCRNQTHAFLSRLVEKNMIEIQE
jgi:hypothetical protein